MGKKTYESKKGRIKDYLKGIISIGVGVVLIIIGIACISILPLAIVLWIVGCPAVVTGIGLIIHNKKNNTHTVYDSPSSSSSSDGTSDYAQWKLRFIKALEFITYGSATVNPQISGGDYNKKIDVIAYISAGNDNDFVHAAERVKSAYKRVAKKCPYSSELKISR